MFTLKKEDVTNLAEHSPEQPKEPYEIMVEQMEAGLKEHNRSNIGLLLSSLSAGLEVGFSILTIGIIYSLFKTEVSPGKLHLMMAMVYPLGYIFVIIGRSELFTEHTVLATIPVIDGEASFKSLFNLWAIIYSGNLIGGYLFGIIVLQFNSGTHIISLDFFHYVSQKMIAYSSINILISSIMAGWLMGTLSWLLSSSQDTLSRVVMIFLITFIVNIAGLHHCIVGSIEIFMAYLSSANHVSGFDFFKFQALSTLGNIIGGVILVAFVKYGHSKRN
ncbi:formate/nitrite transporter family protein [Flavobacterium sp.]|uniref:formate/nitrite transporter family protein n=1 Tax=Flavobacterium sp. TaxID=239 RepID=UPI003BD3BEB8